MVNLFDIMVVILTIGLGVLGFREGFLREAVKLAGMFLTLIVLAVYSSPIVAIALSLDFLPPTLAILFLFGVLFALSVLSFNLLAILLSKLVSLTPVRFVDVGLGCGFGILKALFFCGFVALMLSLAPPNSFFLRQYEGSQFASPLGGFAQTTVPFLKSAADILYRRFEVIPGGGNDEEQRDVAPPAII